MSILEPRYRPHPGQGWITEEEERWLALTTERGWSNITYSESTVFWLQLQRAMRGALSHLLNGISLCSRRTWPYWAGRITGSPRHWRHPWSASRSGLSSFSELPDNASQQREHYLGFRELGELLRRSEEMLLRVPDEILTSCRELTVPSYGEETKCQDRPRVELAKLMRDFQKEELEGLSLYLHGSMATGDYTEFSDVDDLVVVSSPCWHSDEQLYRVAGALARLARAFQEIDPLQHHGHFVVTDFDMVCYDQSVMPLEVLPLGRRVHGRERITACVRDSRAEFRVYLWRTLLGIRHLAIESEARGLNLYWLKHLVGRISLVPALLIQSRGDSTDKATAIVASRNFLSEDSARAIEWATNIRGHWNQWQPTHRIMLARLLARVLSPRRHEAEAVQARLMPRLPPGRPPCPTWEECKDILRLTDECGRVLGELVAHDVR